MSPRLGERDLTPAQLDHAIEVLIEQAFQTAQWKLVARALQVGVEDEETRVATCSRLGEIIMRRLFVLRENDEQVHAFLVEQLALDPEKATVFVLMAVESAKKAVDVFEKGSSLDDVVEELRADQSAEPELARPMVQTGVDFLRRWSPRRGVALLATTTLICHPVLATGIGLAVWLSLFFALEYRWWSATLVSTALFFGLRLVGAMASVKLRLMLGGQRRGVRDTEQAYADDPPH